MKTWSASLKGTLTLSALSLLAFIGYAAMEMLYFRARWMAGDTTAMTEAIVLLLLVGGWLWALFAASGSKRGNWTALLAFSVLAALIALYDLQYASSTPWPKAVMIFVVLVLAMSAIAALWARRRQSSSA